MDTVKVMLCGVSGAMGQTVISCASAMDDIRIVTGFDALECHENFPVYTDITEITEEADVVIDFSHKSVTDTITKWCMEHKKPLVSAVTGISEGSEAYIKEAANEIAVIRSTNFSYGVYVLNKLVYEAARLLDEGYDIELTEAHHNKKADAPSGTAKTLLGNIDRARGFTSDKVYTRNGECKRTKGEIGVHALRGGTISGEHTVLFAGDDELIEIKHSAASKKIFGNGALNAAKFLKGKPAGIYTMDDIAREKN